MTSNAGPGMQRQPNAAGFSPRAVKLVLVILAGAGLYVAASFARGPREQGPAPAGNLPAYQRLARTLPFSEQSTVQELQDALPIIERMRSTSGRWPEATALAAQGLSPFSPSPVTGKVRLSWRLFRSGLVINYLGIPADPETPAAWLLAIVEPDPAAPPDTAPNDEEHHRLDDGTVLHVSIWRHEAGGALPSAFVMQPQTKGWVQLYDTLPTAAGR